MNSIFSKDAMNNADFKKVGYAAMRVVDGLQRHEPEARILALAVVFAQVCKLYGVRPMDAMETAGRVADRRGQSDEIRAAQMYVNREMNREAKR